MPSLSPTPPVTIGLIVTHKAAAPGSMSRYAALVADALLLDPERFAAESVSVAMPAALWRVLPARLATWANHAWCRVAVQTLRRRKPDLWHLLDGSYAYLVPALKRAPVVVTVHDLIPWLQSRGAWPDVSPSGPARRLVAAGTAGLRRAHQVVADSAATRRDAVAAGVLPGRVAVVHLALPRAAEAPHSGSVARPVEIPRILHVGHGGFYKNRAQVLRVFASLRSTTVCALDLAGAPLTRRERRLVGNLRIAADVKVWPRCGDDDLNGLYRRATLLLFPSLYEGFGWPPLEAMARGCPVVCSNAASLPEIVGDAALLSAPTDTEGLSNHCLRLLSDHSFAAEMARRGRERVQHFTLARMAAGLSAAYDRALGALTSDS